MCDGATGGTCRHDFFPGRTPGDSYGWVIVGNDNQHDEDRSWFNTGDDISQEGFFGVEGDFVQAGVDIWAQYYDAKGQAVYMIDILWGNMAFVFEQETEWNPITLRYEVKIERWAICEHQHNCTRTNPIAPCDTNSDNRCSHTCEDVGTDCAGVFNYLGGELDTFDVTTSSPRGDDNITDFEYSYKPTNNEIRVTNRSDDGVTAGFAFSFLDENGVPATTGDNLFNTTGGNASAYDAQVQGNFFVSNQDAFNASRWIKNANVIDTNLDPLRAKFNRTTFNPVPGIGANRLVLASAARAEVNSVWEVIDMPLVDGTLEEPTTFNHTISNTQQSQSVFFAFSGRPDYDAPLLVQSDRGSSARQRYGIFEVWGEKPEHRVGSIIISITPVNCEACRLGGPLACANDCPIQGSVAVTP